MSNMSTQTKELARQSQDFIRLSDGREISRYLAKDSEGNTFTGGHYKGVWLVERLGKPYFYPTSKDIDRMAFETGVMPSFYEATRTLVLFPDSKGRLTERASRLGGRGRLTGYKSPVVSQDFTVHGYYKKDKFDHLEINPDTLRPYPELNAAIRMLDGRPGILYIQGWNKGLPVMFGNQPSRVSIFKDARAWIDPRADHGHGERLFLRLGGLFDVNLSSSPSVLSCAFRLGRADSLF